MNTSHIITAVVSPSGSMLTTVKCIVALSSAAFLTYARIPSIIQFREDILA